MRVLVTNAGGCIGSHLCERLAYANNTVTGVEDFEGSPYAAKLKQRNLDRVLDNKHFTLVEKITDYVDCESSTARLSDLDVLIHVYPETYERPLNFPIVPKAHWTETVAIAKMVRELGIEKFILTVPAGVYGNRKRLPCSESDAIDSPAGIADAYARGAELIAHALNHQSGTGVTCLRLFNVYGSRQNPYSAVYAFTEQIVRGVPVRVHGDGETERDFINVKDVINGLMAAIEKCRGFNIYNLGSGKSVTLIDLIQLIETIVDRKPTAILGMPVPPGTASRLRANIEKAARELGWAPAICLEEGLQSFYKWFLAETAEQ